MNVTRDLQVLYQINLEKKIKNYNNNSLIPGIIYLLYFCQIDIKNNIQY